MVLLFYTHFHLMQFHTKVLLFHTVLCCNITVTAFCLSIREIFYDTWWMVRFCVGIMQLVVGFPEKEKLSNYQVKWKIWKFCVLFVMSFVIRIFVIIGPILEFSITSTIVDLTVFIHDNISLQRYMFINIYHQEGSCPYFCNCTIDLLFWW